MFRTNGPALALGAAMAAAAPAGGLHAGRTGLAATGHSVAARFDRPQAPVGLLRRARHAGRAAIPSTHRDGHCACGGAVGGKLPADPAPWRILDGKLYLNIIRAAVAAWQEYFSGNLTRAAQNWVALEPEPASRRRIPGFRSPAPLAN